MSGTTPEPPPDEHGGRRPLPYEPAPDRAPHLELVADDHVVVQEHRHLAALEPFDGQLDLVRAIGGVATEYDRWAVYPSGAVSRIDVVLAGEAVRGLREGRSGRSWLAPFPGGSRSQSPFATGCVSWRSLGPLLPRPSVAASTERSQSPW